MGSETGGRMTPYAREMWSHYYFQTKPIRVFFYPVCNSNCLQKTFVNMFQLHLNRVCTVQAHWLLPSNHRVSITGARHLETEAALPSFHTSLHPLPFISLSQFRFTSSPAWTHESLLQWPSLSRVCLSPPCHVTLVTHSFLDVPGLLFSPPKSLWSFSINSLTISKFLSHLVLMTCIILAYLLL